jgi:hypothetical protein
MSSRTSTWRVSDVDAASPLSEHTSETDAELAARAWAEACGADRVVVHDRYHRAHHAPASLAELRTGAGRARARQLAVVRERARRLAQDRRADQ